MVDLQIVIYLHLPLSSLSLSLFISLLKFIVSALNEN